MYLKRRDATSGLGTPNYGRILEAVQALDRNWLPQ
jgi:hypothetical protein